MTKRRAWAAAVIVVAVLIALGIGYRDIWTASQAVLQARHPKPATAVVAATRPEAIAAGRRLAVITGCTFCHGPALTGPGPGPAHDLGSPNLTLIAPHRSDADLDRAIRGGLNADGTSELAMPAYAYRDLSDAEVADLLGYLRSLAPQGAPVTPPPPGLLTRFAMATGRFHTQVQRLATAKPALDLGPTYAPGRHLAVVACGQCHGSDLAGGEGLPGPDLTLRTYYTRPQFHELMTTGEMPQNVHSELMQEMARASLHELAPAEVDAIYDYLMARDVALSAKRPPPR